MADKVLKALHRCVRDDIGDLVTRRPLPGANVAQIDPFLFLNHHGPQTYPARNRGLPFGPHPHRGFETVTFVIAGELMHRDTAGHESVIRAGGVQWMTAGRGIVHAELSTDDFKRRGGALEILQLWVNLPARLKLAEPRYIGLQREEIPVIPVADGRGKVHLIAGRFDGQQGPVATLTGVMMSTVELPADGIVRVDGLDGRNVLLYVVRGSIRSGAAEAGEHVLAEFAAAGDTLALEATSPTLLLLGHADPIGETVVARGPFVMNTEDEIAMAIREYHAGRFG